MIVILGIGNSLKGDDGVGPYIVSSLKSPRKTSFRDRQVARLNTQLIDAGTVPENYIQKIIDAKPDRIIIIDAVDFGGKPGEVKWFKEFNSANISISTHNMPPELFIDIITQQTGAEVNIIAIQPKELKFNTPLSEEVKESADKLKEELCMTCTQLKTY